MPVSRAPTFETTAGLDWVHPASQDKDAIPLDAGLIARGSAPIHNVKLS
jgi:hypothetical protein